MSPRGGGLLDEQRRRQEVVNPLYEEINELYGTDYEPHFKD